jgi:hypothetical protein
LQNKKDKNMETKTIIMTPTEYKRYLAFKEADKIVRGIKRGLWEVNQARLGNVKLKSARQSK